MLEALEIKRFNGAALGKIRDVSEVPRFLKPLLPEAETFIIKPNWYSPQPGSFTTVSFMKQLLESLDSRVVVIEGYSLDRQDSSMKFHVVGEEVNWNWLMEHGWEWVKEPDYWDEVMIQEEWFLDKYGFKDLFKDYDVEYINVSEEVWKGRVVDPRKVLERVNESNGELIFKEIYGFLPEKLYRHKGSPLISLGKVKGAKGSYPSLSVKNLFGLIPDPMRVWWHGPEDSRLDESIHDIMRLYASFFTLYGLCDGVDEITVVDPKGDLKFPWGRFRVIGKPGIIGFGRNLVELDSVMCGLIGVDPFQVGYLRSEGLRNYQAQIERAKHFSRTWLKLDS